MGLSVIDQLFLLMLSTDYADYSVDIMQALCSKVVNATSKSFYFLPFVSIFLSLMAFLQDSLLDAPKEDGFMTFLKLATLNLVDLKFNPFFSSHWRYIMCLL